MLAKISGATVFRLHGCVGRNCCHVFGPDDPAVRCPRCDTARYENNKAKATPTIKKKESKTVKLKKISKK